MTGPSLSARDSQRLALLKFPLIVLVVMIHAYEPLVSLNGNAVGYGGGSLSQGVRFLISQGLGRVAVPLFFLMAGYFFFLGWTGSTSGLLQRWRARVNSLLVPFLFWNLVAVLALWLAQELPWFAVWVTGEKARVAELSGYGWLNTVLGLTQRPAAYQFWFIRDLMLLVLLTPLLRPLLDRAALTWGLLASLALLWVMNVLPGQVPTVEGALFFCAGAFVAHQGGSLFALDRFATTAGLLYGTAMVWLAVPPWLPHSLVWFRLALLLGVVAVLGLSGSVPTHTALARKLGALGWTSFFVFAVHEPLLSVLRKISFHLAQPDSEGAVLALYFVLPVCTVLLALLLHGLLERVAPALLGVVSGGRVRPHPPEATP